MIILGLDPGIATTGYGIIKKEAGGLTCLMFGCIYTPAGLESSSRLKQLRGEFLKILKKHRPDQAAIERLFFSKNTKTALAVAHARGVTLEALASRAVPVAEFTPPQIKQAVTGYGAADKRQVQKMVRTILRLNDMPRPDDAADALAVAICRAHSDIF